MGMENPEQLTPKQVKREDLNDQEKIRQAHVDSVKEGTSWPTPEGLKDPKIKEAIESYFSSMSEEEADKFAESLADIRTELRDGNPESAGMKLSKMTMLADFMDSMKWPSLLGGPVLVGVSPVASMAMSAFGALSFYLPGKMRSGPEKKQEAFSRAYQHLIDIQQALSETEGNEVLRHEPGFF